MTPPVVITPAERRVIELIEDRDAAIDLFYVIQEVLDETYKDPNACSSEVQRRLHQLGAFARLLGLARDGDGLVSSATPGDLELLGVRRYQRGRR